MASRLTFEKVPQALRSLGQWVCWRYITRDGQPSKFPCQTSGKAASSTNAATWCGFNDATLAYQSDATLEGIGFVFGESRSLVGVDLDGCRDPQTGVVAEWAKKIIQDLDTYAEVSPSQTGVKLWMVGKSPMSGGKKREVAEQPIGDKRPAVEVYDHGRFFCVTGWRLAGVPAEPKERQAVLERYCSQWFPVEAPPQLMTRSTDEADIITRARKYMERVEPAVSGQGGHNQTFKAACILVLGFGLGEGDAYNLLAEWNMRCVPEWSERDLRRKIREATKQPGERNYLRFADQGTWQDIAVPQYGKPAAVEQPQQAKPQTPAAPKSQVKITTLVEAAEAWITRAESGTDGLIGLGLPGVDEAIGGGVAAGEMIVMAARPSHGKTAVALQCVHIWTERGLPTAVVSEEMSAEALGKRAMQWISDTPQEHWFQNTERLRNELGMYQRGRADALIIEGCRSADNAAEQIRVAVRDHGVKCAVVDYAQLLASPGKSRYEQVTNTSVVLRQVANDTKVALIVLAQLSRAIEQRTAFIPQMSDLKESGQIEQDADVVLLMVWPWKCDGNRNPNEYEFHIGKNRNREISQRLVNCRFDPSRQQFRIPKSKLADHERIGYFDDFNNGDF